MNNDNATENRDKDDSSSMQPSRETLPLEADLGPKQRIGNFKLLSVLGEGGMGTVWLAEQDQPVKRRVAVKVIKSGQAPKEFLRRFEAERQALAIMDHPNIAKFLEAGATEDGTPFLAMELVKGLSITEYCDKQKLNIENRLKLFGKVCNAVQHAHQKGIIHSEPVIARPPNFWYHSKKFYSKHRRSVLLSILFLLIAVAGIAGTTGAFISLRAAEKIGELERIRANAAEEAQQALSRKNVEFAAANMQLAEVNEELQLRNTELLDARMREEKVLQENERLRKEIELLRELLKERAGSGD